MRKCRCKASETRREWVDCVHKSGSIRMPTRRRLAEVCCSCAGLISYRDDERTNLILALRMGRKELRND